MLLGEVDTEFLVADAARHVRDDVGVGHRARGRRPGGGAHAEVVDHLVGDLGDALQVALALGALGVTLVFGILRFANFAHGDLMAFGTMVTILVTWWLQSLGVSIDPLPTALLALPEAVRWGVLAERADGDRARPALLAAERPAFLPLSPAQSRMWFINQFDTFFFNDTATTEIYTLSLHDALPI